MTQTLRPSLPLFLLLIASLAGCGDRPGLAAVEAIDSEDDPCFNYICNGEFLDGLTWRDSRGLNAFVVSREIERSNDRVVRNSLNVSRMIMVRPDDARERWKSSHVVQDQCGEGLGLIGDIVVSDIDGNGIGEVTYLCNVDDPCDSTRPSAEIVMHAGQSVYEASVSAAPSASADADEDGTIVYGRTLEGAPEVFRSFVDSLWHARASEFQSWTAQRATKRSRPDDQ